MAPVCQHQGGQQHPRCSDEPPTQDVGRPVQPERHTAPSDGEHHDADRQGTRHPSRARHDDRRPSDDDHAGHPHHDRCLCVPGREGRPGAVEDQVGVVRSLAAHEALRHGVEGSVDGDDGDHPRDGPPATGAQQGYRGGHQHHDRGPAAGELAERDGDRAHRVRCSCRIRDGLRQGLVGRYEPAGLGGHEDAHRDGERTREQGSHDQAPCHGTGPYPPPPGVSTTRTSPGPTSARSALARWVTDPSDRSTRVAPNAPGDPPARP